MKKGTILYKSKYGASKTYAQWLHELTGYEMIELTKANNSSLIDTDLIIHCGGIYASGIAGLTVIKKYKKLWTDKKFIILCVGASPYDEKVFQECKERNLKGDLNDVSLYYARGAWNESKMTKKDKILCHLLKKAISKKDPSTYELWMKALMSSIGKTMDWTDKEYLKPIIEECKKEMYL